ncbi:MAG: restriction endonuclease subunit S [Pseudoalteromonas sp.]
MVPNGWEIHSISDIAEVKGGKRLPKGYTLQPEPNAHPYIRVTDMFDGGVSLDSIQYVPEEAVNAISRYKISTSDIFITVAGTLGIVGIIPEQLDGANLTENADKLTNLKIDQRFLLEMLRSPIVQSHIEAEKTTNAQPKLALTRIKGFKIPVPPLPEQRKIAKILSTWDKAISTTERLIDNSKQQKKALMQQLLTGKKRLLDDSGKPFEGEWEEVKLSHFFERVMEKNNGQSKNVVTISAQQGLIRQEEFFKKSVASETLDNYFILRKGQFAYNKSYSNGYPMGAIKRLNRYDDAVVTSLYICFELKDEQLASSCFMEQFFESGLLNRGLKKVAAEGGRAHGLLNVKPADFMALSMAVPKINEQQKIASVLTNTDQQIELLEQQLADLKQEKKALMQQLLTGKRRVKVDDKEVA